MSSRDVKNDMKAYTARREPGCNYSGVTQTTEELSSCMMSTNSYVFDARLLGIARSVRTFRQRILTRTLRSTASAHNSPSKNATSVHSNGPTARSDGAIGFP